MSAIPFIMGGFACAWQATAMYKSIKVRNRAWKQYNQVTQDQYNAAHKSAREFTQNKKSENLEQAMLNTLLGSSHAVVLPNTPFGAAVNIMAQKSNCPVHYKAKVLSEMVELKNGISHMDWFQNGAPKSQIQKVISTCHYDNKALYSCICLVQD